MGNKNNIEGFDLANYLTDGVEKIVKGAFLDILETPCYYRIVIQKDSAETEVSLIFEL